jgi:hypothetical protein
MSDIEGKILKIYDKSKPEDEDLYETSNVNHLAWSLVVVLGGLVFWLALTLVNAENQRNALASKMCRDPVFTAEINTQCLVTVRSRDHWWQHLWYGFTHVAPDDPKQGHRYDRRQPAQPAAQP